MRSRLAASWSVAVPASMPGRASSSWNSPSTEPPVQARAMYGSMSKRSAAANPVIKVEDLAWLEFEKPDLDAAERFAHDFGFCTAYRDDAGLHLRGTLPGSPCMIIRTGGTSRYTAA